MTPDAYKRLRAWFIKNAAELPWRPFDVNAPRDPYAVWISETMLQQTQVSTVREYFTRWMERFPDVATLAAATEEEVFKFWQGLGYYSRARNILKTAKIVAQKFKSPTESVAESSKSQAKDVAGSSRSQAKDSAGSSRSQAESVTESSGKIIAENKESSAKSASGPKQPQSQMPATRKELEALPGIGAYTAGAILSLALHKREAILDGNLVRVFSRFYMLDFLPTDSREKAEVYWDFARQAADHAKGYLHNEALMELGRTTCKIKNADCVNCPLKAECKAFAADRVNEFPPSKKHLQKDWHGTVLVIESADQKILAVHGGQKFFKNQLALPHFESPKNAAVGFPAEAAQFVAVDLVERVEDCGTFKHGITVHKMECRVLYFKATVPARNLIPEISNEFRWIEKARVAETLANSFSLKALQRCKILGR